MSEKRQLEWAWNKLMVA